MRETWLVLEDGRKVDPSECNADNVHIESGVPVKMRMPGVPMSAGVDPDEERAKAAAAEKSSKKTKADAEEAARKEAEQAQASATADKALDTEKPGEEGKPGQKPYKNRELKTK